jgi:hypothetical protein
MREDFLVPISVDTDFLLPLGVGFVDSNFLLPVSVDVVGISESRAIPNSIT